jgi:hypothetical protein
MADTPLVDVESGSELTVAERFGLA